MRAARKITIEVPADLLEKAQRESGTGITGTVRAGLELVAASHAYARLRSLRGKVKFSHPLEMDEVAVDHRNVNFVICHMGNPWIRDCMEVVYKNANVYTDMSGLTLGEFEDRFEVFLRKQVSEMLSYGVEPDALLYGTDWPISSMESYLDFMKELAIPQKERRMIMAENALELYGLDRGNSLIGNGARR